MLKIAKGIFQKIVKHCEEGYPSEVCGLLLGKRSGEEKEIREIRRAKNLNTERARDRFELDPADFLAADSSARAQAMEIIGFYHSHPDHPPQASQTDAKHAWEGYSYLILSIRNQRLDQFKVWRLDRGAMQETALEVIHGKG